jgi:hypothetical protein
MLLYSTRQQVIHYHTIPTRLQYRRPKPMSTTQLLGRIANSVSWTAASSREMLDMITSWKRSKRAPSIRARLQLCPSGLNFLQ